MSKDLVVINEAIRSPIVLLILANGEKKGQFAKAAAIQMARDAGMDLLQVAPGNPPVCKIADFGKMKFDKSKQEKKQNHSLAIKQIRFGIDIAQHDLDIKTKKIDELIAKGHKVIVMAELKGRQKYSPTHKDMAIQKVKDLITAFGGKVTASPVKAGDGQVTTTLSPL